MEMEWEPDTINGNEEEDSMEEEKPIMEIDPNVGQLIIVPDTNIWIAETHILRELFDKKFDKIGFPVFVIPWMVQVELDNIKGHMSKARSSNHYINYLLRSKSPRVRSQKADECAIGELKFKGTNNDDSILQCAQQSFKNQDSVVLVTNDVNLMNKALGIGIKSCKGREVFKYIMTEILEIPTLSDQNLQNSQIEFHQMDRKKPSHESQRPAANKYKGYARKPIRQDNQGSLQSNLKNLIGTVLKDRVPVCYEQKLLDSDKDLSDLPEINDSDIKMSNQNELSMTNNVLPLDLQAENEDTPMIDNIPTLPNPANSLMTHNRDSAVIIKDVPMASSEYGITNTSESSFNDGRKKFVPKKRKDLIGEKRSFKNIPSSSDMKSAEKRKSGEVRKEPEIKKRISDDDHYKPSCENHKGFLKLVQMTISKVIRMQMKSVIGEYWESSLKVKQPWGLEGSIDCLIKHWNTAFTDIFTNKGLGLAKALLEAVRIAKFESKLKSPKQEKFDDEVIQGAIGLFNMAGRGKEAKKEVEVEIEKTLFGARKLILNFIQKRDTGNELFKKD